jgi:hypothetical protein
MPEVCRVLYYQRFAPLHVLEWIKIDPPRPLFRSGPLNWCLEGNKLCATAQLISLFVDPLESLADQTTCRFIEKLLVVST